MCTHINAQHNGTGSSAGAFIFLIQNKIQTANGIEKYLQAS